MRVPFLALMMMMVAGGLAAQQPAHPNIVLIITDDVGYGDIGSYGAKDIKTPNIDRLSRNGVRFTDFYGAPQCTPTRAALISGRYQQRARLERALGSVGPSLDMGLRANGRSLPQLLKNTGYATGLVGKWHLGYKKEYSPNAHGFDYFYGFLSGYVDYYHHVRGDGAPDFFENDQPVSDTGYMTDLITARAKRFVEQNAKKPFFLEVAYNAAHWPFQTPGNPTRAANNGAFQGPADSIPATRAQYVEILQRADRGIGEILETLDKLGLDKNTLVIFTNDNGGEWLSRNAPFFHRKDTLWEGGIRVPLIMRWPGHITPATNTGKPGITMDLTRTILAAAGATIPADAQLEGEDLLGGPRVLGATEVERSLYWRIATPGRQQRAVRRGNWKLLVDNDDVMLFDLTRDVGERVDLAAIQPTLVRTLLNGLRAWERDVDAEAARLP